MAKILSRFRLKNMSMLQTFILFHCLYLAAVLTAIVFEFDWAARLQLHFAGHPYGNDWVLPAQIAAMLLTVGIGLVIMGSLFYRLKLKKPLDVLMSASEKISANDLGFHVVYDGKDEMGELCRAFEKMRSQMENNFKALWRSVEERNQLNAIFAHDLRTPLSVMKGYVEFTAAYLPQKKISEEKLLETMQTMQTHILRMERYVEAMNSIQKLEDIPVNRRETAFALLTGQLDDTARRIAGHHGKTFGSRQAADSAKVFVDTDLAMQVFENMMANAARYAAGRIEAEYVVANGMLTITVGDDGPGFSDEALQKALLPFYRSEGPEASGHQGLGLYICSVLCRKHQGGLRAANGPLGGGMVTASFYAELINR
ncbi:HAMP domain-containing sensor histidine kinase [Paenibacillus cookii]|uniref:histidine kinase n=1 Tax=Paenibacillus cookii TaxID=157839 RepID=A0ABQ4M148_9BACL|nr:HAMP domain-containing sensor histidine kinase [Paenibacillus cookii]GIO69229.1 two-component sensor histidine kinase [Paenibacillus cookii]